MADPTPHFRTDALLSVLHLHEVQVLHPTTKTSYWCPKHGARPGTTWRGEITPAHCTVEVSDVKLCWNELVKVVTKKQNVRLQYVVSYPVVKDCEVCENGGYC